MQAGQRVAVTQAEQRQGGCLCRLQEVIQQSLGGRSCRAALRLRRSVCTLLCTYHRCVEDKETDECESAASWNRHTLLMQQTQSLDDRGTRHCAHRRSQQRIAVQGSQLGPPRMCGAGSSQPGNDKLDVNRGTASRSTTQ